MKRLATLEAPNDLGAAGTHVINIRLSEQISRIYLKWKYTVVTVSVNTANPYACLSKIELVDGGDVLMSVTGQELAAINYYEDNKYPETKQSLTVGEVVEASLALSFGRFLYDSQLAIRPEMFTNLQLRITWDEDAANATVVVNSFAAYAAIDDNPGGGGAKAFILSREIFTNPMAASSHSYPSLPRDYPIRRIYLQGYSEDHDVKTLYGNFRLEIDKGKNVLFDIPADQFVSMVESAYPTIAEEVTLDAVVTAKTLYPAANTHPQIKINYDATAFVTAQSKFAVPTFTGVKLALAASVDIAALHAVIYGHCPHGVIPFDFGDIYDPGDALDPRPYQEVRLDLQSSSDADSGDTENIVVQQIRPY